LRKIFKKMKKKAGQESLRPARLLSARIGPALACGESFEAGEEEAALKERRRRRRKKKKNIQGHD
jgi:hypothetical protein